MTEVLPAGGGNNHLIIPTDKIPPAAWQAIYHHLTKKSETNRKLYPGAYEIDKHQILDLLEKISQTIVGYSPQAEKVEISVSFKKDSDYKFSGVQKFLATDLSHKASCTKSIIIDYDFIISPGTELEKVSDIPQRYKIFIVLDQDFFEESGSREEDFFEDGLAGKNIFASISFADYSVARSLQATLDDWVGALCKRTPSKWLVTIPKVLRESRGSIPVFVSALLSISLAQFMNPITIPDLFYCVLMSLTGAAFAFGLSLIFLGWSAKTISTIQPTTYLLLSKGDRDRKDEIEGRIATRSTIFGVISTVVVLGFIIGVLSSVFVEYFFK